MYFSWGLFFCLPPAACMCSDYSQVKEEQIEVKLAAIESDWAATNLVRVLVCLTEHRAWQTRSLRGTARQFNAAAHACACAHPPTQMFADYKTRGPVILKPSDTAECIEKLEDSQMQLGSMATNRCVCVCLLVVV
jgi:hypothetical protein